MLTHRGMIIDKYLHFQVSMSFAVASVIYIELSSTIEMKINR